MARGLLLRQAYPAAQIATHAETVGRTLSCGSASAKQQQSRRSVCPPGLSSNTLGYGATRPRISETSILKLVSRRASTAAGFATEESSTSSSKGLGSLVAAKGDQRFIFVGGKGGVGKTTTAA